MLKRKRNSVSLNSVSWCAAVLLFVVAVACEQQSEPGAKRMQAGQQFSGFLSDYSGLKPNPNLEGEALTYVNPDEMKGLRSYVAIIVDPVEVYVATDADDSLIPQRAREAVANYFRHALGGALSDVYPVIDSPGPLVLRLRTAVVGVDLGGDVAPMGKALADASNPLQRAIVIDKVGVEMELVDSETGERIAAAVDKMNLGAGAEVGAENFSRLERFSEAMEAFDGWAERVRDFLDSEHQLTGEDAERARQSYRPYGQ